MRAGTKTTVVISLIAACLLLPVILSIPFAAAQSTNFKLDAVLTAQNPYPSEPGNNVNIEVEIQNSGDGAAEGVSIEIAPKEPFTLLPGEEKIKTFTKISARDSVKASYNLHIDSGAISNNYEILFYLKALNTPTVTEKILIDVKGDPDLTLQELTTSPATIEPGASVDLIIKIRNRGTGKASQIKGNISFSAAEITPELSKGLIYIDEIAPDEIGFATFTVNVDPSAEHKTYTGSISMSFMSDNNTKSTISFPIGLPVKGKINLQVIKVEPDYERQRLQVDVANLGTSEAKSLEAKLVIDNNTIDIDYTSELKANKQTTFDFPLIYKGTGVIVINYIGPGIETNTVTKEIAFNYEQPASDGSGMLNLVIGIVIVVAIYLVYRRCRKGRKKAQ